MCDATHIEIKHVGSNFESLLSRLESPCFIIAHSQAVCLHLFQILLPFIRFIRAIRVQKIFVPFVFKNTNVA